LLIIDSNNKDKNITVEMASASGDSDFQFFKLIGCKKIGDRKSSTNSNNQRKPQGSFDEGG